MRLDVTKSTRRIAVWLVALAVVVSACSDDDVVGSSPTSTGVGVTTTGDPVATTTSTTAANASGGSTQPTTPSSTTTSGGSTTSTSAGSTTSTTDASGVTTTSVGTTNTTQAPSPTFDIAAGETLLERFGVSSIRRRFEVVVDATDPAEAGSFLLVEEHVAAQNALRVTIDLTGGEDEEERIEFRRIDTTAWLFEAGIWEEIPMEFVDLLASVSAVPAAEDILDGLPELSSSAEYVDMETLNGRETLRYRLDADLVDFPPTEIGTEFSVLGADLWIDVATGALLKTSYVVEEIQPGDGSMTTYRVVFEIDSFDESITIEPPE